MSGKIMGIVWESDLPQNEKFVLLAYADHADHDGASVFPSVGLVAWKTGYSSRNIIRIKQKLIQRGILVQTGMRESGIHIFRIDIDAIPRLKPSSQKNGVSKARSNFNRNRDKLALKVVERDGYTCVNCGKVKGLTVDHIKPISKDGTDDLINLQLLCKSCNSKKGAK